jgi:hypothetical protein
MDTGFLERMRRQDSTREKGSVAAEGEKDRQAATIAAGIFAALGITGERSAAENSQSRAMIPSKWKTASRNEALQ